MTKLRQPLCILHCALCIAIAAHGAEIAATAASAIAVDSREGEVRAVAPEDIGYSPFWGGVTNGDAYVVIEKVEHAGMFNAATSEIATMAAGAEGDLSYSPAAGDARCVRLVHRVYDAGGTEIGTPLERDVAFGFAMAATAGTAADGRDNLLQREAALNKVVGLTYDTSWATNADSVAISAVQLKDREGRDLDTPVTNVLFSAHGYTQLTYIKSSGTQYIDTRVVPKTTTRVVCDFQLTVMPSDRVRSGWASAGSKEAFWFGSDNDHANFSCSVSGNSVQANTGVPVDTNRHSFDISASAIKFDGANVANPGSAFNNAASGNTMYLFASRQGWSPNVGSYGSMNIYSCQIYDGDTLVRNYIPARRNSDMAVGLFDLKNGEFFGNAGTGSFTEGDFVGSPAGTFYKTLKSGGWRFLHTSFDKDGNIICAPYFADYFLMSKGTTILIR